MGWVKRNLFEKSRKIEAQKQKPNPPTELTPKSQGKFKLPKKERIKSKKLMETVFGEGKGINDYPLKLIYLEAPFSDGARFKIAVVAPKKNFRLAVNRNRIKRLLRETYRLNKAIIFNNSEGNFALVFLYLGKQMPEYQEIEEKMVGLLKKFLKKTAVE